MMYRNLDFYTVHLCIYMDGAFQNLATKQFQLGFAIAISDRNDGFNLVRWHSSPTTRRSYLTEEIVVIAFDSGMKSIRFIKMILFQLLK